MNIALLTISSLSLVCSASCLVVMLKTAHELQTVKKQVDNDIAAVKTKVGRNAKVVKTALSALEL